MESVSQSSPTTENRPPTREISLDSPVSAPLCACESFERLDRNSAANVPYSIRRDLYFSARSWWFSWALLSIYRMQDSEIRTNLDTNKTYTVKLCNRYIGRGGDGGLQEGGHIEVNLCLRNVHSLIEFRLVKLIRRHGWRKVGGKAMCKWQWTGRFYVVSSSH